MADDTTRDIWNGVNSKAARRIPRDIWPVVQRRLDQLDSVTNLEQLRVPPGNRLHALVDELTGFHAIRVNDQYRIVFRFEGEHAFWQALHARGRRPRVKALPRLAEAAS